MHVSGDSQRSARRPFARILKWTALVLAVAVVAASPFAGRLLVSQDPLDKADVIVVLAGRRVVRWMEAADLYREGWAPRILLSPGQAETAEALARSRGVHVPGEAELGRDALMQLQIPARAIEVMPESVDNTAQEAAQCHELAARNKWRRIIVVTSKYHSRRTAFAFRREFRGTPVTILVRASRYDSSRPEKWWAARADVRFVLSEYGKLLLYRLGLGA